MRRIIEVLNRGYLRPSLLARLATAPSAHRCIAAVQKHRAISGNGQRTLEFGQLRSHVAGDSERIHLYYGRNHLFLWSVEFEVKNMISCCKATESIVPALFLTKSYRSKNIARS